MTTIPTARTNEKTSLATSAVRWSSAVRYHYIKGRVGFFMSAGLNLSSGFNTTNSYVVTTTIPILPDRNSETFRPAIDNWEDTSYGWLLGAGLSYGRIIVEGRYERSTGMSGDLRLASPMNVLQLTVGYRFK